MADEELEYRINFDEDDLAQKLDRIRGQIDLALGSSAAGSSPLPAFSDVSNAALGAQSGGNFSQQQDQSFWSQVSNFVDASAYYTQLGASKFQDDLRRIGLLSEPSYPSTIPNFPTLLTGETPSGAERFADAFMSNAFTASFTAGGAAIGGPVGAFTGFTIGGGIDFAADIAFSRSRAKESMVGGLREVAAQSFGQLSREQATGIASGIQDQVYSFDGRMRGLDMDQVQSNILGFANAGGLQNVGSASQMESVLNGVVQNARTFAENLGMAQEEAVQIMAQLEQRMIATTSQAGSLSQRLVSTAESMGMTPGQSLMLGMQGAEMTRGTGISAEQGFNLAQESRMQVSRLFASGDPLLRNALSDYMSPEQAAIAQMESSTRFMLSGQGMMHSGAILAGNNSIPGAGGNLSSMLTSFGQFASNPQDLIALPILAPMVANSMSFPEMQTRQVGTALSTAKAMGLADRNGNVREDVLMSLLMRHQGMNRTDAIAAVRSVQQGFGDVLSAQQSEPFFDIQSGIQSKQKSFYNLPGSVVGAIGDGVSEVLFLDELGDAFVGAQRNLAEGINDVYDSFTGVTTIETTAPESEGVRRQMANFLQLPEQTDDLINDINIQGDVADRFISNQNTDYRYIAAGLENTPEYLDAFKELSFGLTTSGKRQLLVDIQKAAKNNVSVSDIRREFKDMQSYAYGDRLTPEEEKNAQSISDSFLTRRGKTPLVNASSTREMQNQLSYQMFNSPYSELTDEQKRSIYITTNQNVDLRRQWDSMTNFESSSDMRQSTQMQAIEAYGSTLMETSDSAFSKVSNIIDNPNAAANIRGRLGISAIRDYIPFAGGVSSTIGTVREAMRSGNYENYEAIMGFVQSEYGPGSDQRNIAENFLRVELGRDNVNSALAAAEEGEAARLSAENLKAMDEFYNSMGAELSKFGLSGAMQVLNRKASVGGDIRLYNSSNLSTNEMNNLLSQLRKSYNGLEGESLMNAVQGARFMGDKIVPSKLMEDFMNKGEYRAAEEIFNQSLGSGGTEKEIAEMMKNTFIRGVPINVKVVEND